MKLTDRRIVVTGCSGFIASHLVEKLIDLGNEIIGIDNFSAGRKEFMSRVEGNEKFTFVEGDLRTMDLNHLFQGVDVVCHMAANPDVRIGAENTSVHFDQNIMVTYRILEAMKNCKVGCILFPSTSAIYGETTVVPTREDYGPLIPISLYGASKLSCEALIDSYCNTFDINGVIWRFANVVGTRSTHNVLHDFIRKLNEDPGKLEILGTPPGTWKSYIHVSDCVDAMIASAQKNTDLVGIYNIGSKDSISVLDIADITVKEMGLCDVKYVWSGGVKGGGWNGDVKRMLLSIDKISDLGWEPKLGSADAIGRAVREIITK